LFGGRAAPLVAHLADGRGLSAEDIEELDALLEELKRERD
ncbi:MAG: CopY family transcriptional repressor, partial [Pseudomonadota bacterium]